MNTRTKIGQIEMAHGAGGKATRRLIEGVIVPALSNPILETLSDAALLTVEGARIATTADGFVVKPLAFTGGSIGSLAVHGTINDLAVSGATPVALLATMILEAGLPGDVLEREVEAMAAAARACGVCVVGGDTKVVEHGMADGMYISTFGIGLLDERLTLGPQHVRAGDRVLLSGPIGDHGITILLARGELDLEAEIGSDTRAVTPFVDALRASVAPGLRWMRDPTRGGVATVLNELAYDAQVGVVLDEDAIPVRSEVRGACEILGLDPLHIANEGQFIAIIAPEHADSALDAVRRVSGGQDAVLIGEIVEQPGGVVITRTRYGGTRVVDMLVGDPLPRIC
ncbi:MAG TPA: hydrogenase expression/formation protein HypE [Candidatus Baltobacteraceae bacterium]|nr:hydrogenase expression/formation protein HypE [Candidatus Baltobacteraceae bacterium]